MHVAFDGLIGTVVPAAQAVSPSVIEQVPPSYRATAAFALVVAFGAAVLFRSQRFVEAAVDSSMGRPHVSVVYGGIAYGLVAFLGLLALMQLSLVGITDSAVVYAAAAVVGMIAFGLGGLGYVVVGTRSLELLGDRQPWNGLVIGAVLSAVIWLVLPSVTAAVVWLGVAAVGIGGPVRTWMHDERGVAGEIES